MHTDTPHILLVNPWIHDFAAYDFWAKPLGLLQLAAILRSHGIGVSYIDCLDRFHPKMDATVDSSKQGRGAYLKEKIPAPAGLEDVPRNYSRYGIRVAWFMEDLSRVPKPDMILLTSLMTYWYPGVQETIRFIRKMHPDTPIILGGIYASLCRKHAEMTSGADMVIPGPGEHLLLALIEDTTGFSKKPHFHLDNVDAYPYPAFDLQHYIPYVPLLTSKGCPFACSYCASHYLNPKKIKRNPAAVVEEIVYWHKNRYVVDFAFYDDALLVNPDRHIIPILEGVIKMGINVRFHTPNAIHVRGITKTIAYLMLQAGFETIRLGVETTDNEESHRLDDKFTAEEFSQSIQALRDVGFRKNQIGAYLLVGLPGQSQRSIARSIQIVKACGIMPVPAYYSPIPHTALWEDARAASRYDLEADPVFTNNAVMPCSKEPFSWEAISALKRQVHA